jgi:hypothetical protein
MTSPSRFVVSYTTRGTEPAAIARIRGLMWGPQAIIGMFLLGLAYFMGRDHFDLIWSGARTQGRITGFIDQEWKPSGNRLPVTAHMPMVEYSLGSSRARFIDWLAGRPGEDRNAVVPVLYLPARPSIAMIDRPLWNWIPWGPTAAVGILLILSALGGFWRFVRQRQEEARAGTPV